MSLHARRAAERALGKVLIGLALALPAVPGLAAEVTPFTQSGFVAAERAGKPVLVDIRASWCPTCAAQKPILDRLLKRPEFENLVMLTVDFDAQKDVVRAFHAQMQSTLIAFKGSTETGRSVGDTREQSIATLLRSAER